MTVHSEQEYKEHVIERLGMLKPFLQNYATGKYDQEIPVPDKEDEFTDLFVGMNLMVSDFQQLLYERDNTISELKKTRKELQEYKDHLEEIIDERTIQIKLFQKFVESSSQGCGIASLDGKIRYANAKLRTLIDIDDNTVIENTDFTQFYTSETRNKINNEIIPEVIEKGSWDGELELITAKNNHIKTHEHFSLIRNKNNEPQYITDIIADITNQKIEENQKKIRAEIVLQVGKLSYISDILNYTLEVVFSYGDFDSGGVYLVDDNSGCIDLLVHKNLPDWFVEGVKHFEPDDIRAQIISKGKPVYQHVSEYPPEVRTDIENEGIKSLGIIPIKLGGKVIGALNLASHQHDEISENNRKLLETIAESDLGNAIKRIKAEDELRKSMVNLESRVTDRTLELQTEKDFSEHIINSLPDIFYIIDHSKKFSSWNRKLEQITGFEREELLKMSPVDLVPFEKQLVLQFIREVYKFGASTLECKIKTKVGDIIPYYFTGSLVNKGQQTFLIGMGLNITDRIQAEEKLKQNETRLRVILDHLPFGVLTIDNKKKIQSVNKAAMSMMKYSSPSDIIGKFCHETMCPANENSCPILDCGKQLDKSEKVMLTSDGERIPILKSAVPVRLDSRDLLLEAFVDITRQKKVESELRISEERFKSFFDIGLIGMAVTSPEKGWVLINNRLCEILGYSRPELMKKTWADVTHPEDINADVAQFNRVISGEIDEYSMDKRFIRGNDIIIYARIAAKAVRDENGKVDHFLALVDDISERKFTELALIESEKKYRSLFEVMNEGYALHEIITNKKNKPIDYRYLEINPAFEKFTGLKAEDVVGRTVCEILPGTENDPADWIGQFGQVALTGNEILVDQYSEVLDTWYRVHGFSHEHRKFAVTFTDITDQKKYEKKLQEAIHNLERSNRDLEQFAYVASHDLQEPLRKIQAFGDRLGIMYSDMFDNKGKDYLNRMIKASERAQILINDLLAFSRVATRGKPFKLVDLNILVQDILDVFELRMQESKATIILEDLPEIMADQSQMRQLFQNLIGNALKFINQEKTPIIKITSTIHDDKCIIIVEDNGIGFEQKYADKIFVIFQRLNRRAEYDGTGIGLAVCKKIVERHRGTIEVKSEEGVGSRFIITLPINHANNTDEGEKI